MTGASGVALGIAANFAAAGLLGGRAGAFVAQSGPALGLAGSCSATTLAQVAGHAGSHPSFAIDVAALSAGAPVAAAALDLAAANRLALPLIYSSAVAGARGEALEAAAAVEACFAEIAANAVAAGFTRLVVAGGETSGAVVGGLGLAAFDIGP